MSFGSDTIGAAQSQSTAHAQMVETQMRRVHQKIDRLEMEKPPEESDIKAAASALKRVESLVDVVA